MGAYTVERRARVTSKQVFDCYSSKQGFCVQDLGRAQSLIVAGKKSPVRSYVRKDLFRVCAELGVWYGSMFPVAPHDGTGVRPVTF
jgi:hypothetical protein